MYILNLSLEWNTGGGDRLPHFRQNGSILSGVYNEIIKDKYLNKNKHLHFLSSLKYFIIFLKFISSQEKVSRTAASLLPDLAIMPMRTAILPVCAVW